MWKTLKMQVNFANVWKILSNFLNFDVLSHTCDSSILSIHFRFNKLLENLLDLLNAENETTLFEILSLKETTLTR